MLAHDPTKPIVSERPLKGAAGQYGGRVRCRLECAIGLVVRCERTLVEARELSAELFPSSWADAPPATDAVVRRYDVSPPLARDALLEARVDAI